MSRPQPIGCWSDLLSFVRYCWWGEPVTSFIRCCWLTSLSIPVDQLLKLGYAQLRDLWSPLTGFEQGATLTNGFFCKLRPLPVRTRDLATQSETQPFESITPLFRFSCMPHSLLWYGFDQVLPIPFCLRTFAFERPPNLLESHPATQIIKFPILPTLITRNFSFCLRGPISTNSSWVAFSAVPFSTNYVFPYFSVHKFIHPHSPSDRHCW